MTRRAWLAVLLLLPACATGRRGEEFTGRAASAGEALQCAVAEVGRLGYRVTTLPAAQGVSGGSFRAERWLSPREGGVRALAVLSVSARDFGVGRTRLRVDADRYENMTGGTDLAGTGGVLRRPDLGSGRPQPASVDSALRGTPRRTGMKRLAPGPAGADAQRVRAACAESSGG